MQKIITNNHIMITWRHKHNTKHSVANVFMFTGQFLVTPS